MATNLKEYAALLEGMDDATFAETAGITVEEAASFRAEQSRPAPVKPQARAKPAKPDAATTADAPRPEPGALPHSIRMCANIKVSLHGRTPYQLNFRDIVTEATHPGVIAFLVANPTVRHPKHGDVQAFEVYPREG